MPAAGDDLREHLIAPFAPSSSSDPLSSQPTGSIASTSSRPDTPRVHKPVNRRAEASSNSSMEIDHPTEPVTRTSARAEDAGTALPLEIDVNAFLATYQAEHDALMQERYHEEVKGPPAKKSKTNDASATPQPVAEKTSDESAKPQPIAVGARSSKYTILLFQRCQTLAIPLPQFTYKQNYTKWLVSVSFSGLDDVEELQNLEEDGKFNSKQEAKEAASKTALAVLEKLVGEGRVTSAKKPKGQPALPKEKEEPGENFVGKLLEFQNATSSPQPLYTDYLLGTRFACLVELEGYSKPFSSLDALFGSKKAARQHAAGCAVAHLKTLGLWPDNVGGIKKRKSAANTTSPSPAEGSNAGAGSDAKSTVLSQVVALANLLSLGAPEYRFESDATNLHTVSCFFKNGGQHEGPIGEVRNVLGKKRAKEECARLVFEYLSEEKKRREAIAAKLSAGVEEVAGVKDMGVGMMMNGKFYVGAKTESEHVMFDEDDLDIYEDAVEH